MATLVQAIRMALHYGETHLGVTDIFGEDVDFEIDAVAGLFPGQDDFRSRVIDQRDVEPVGARVDDVMADPMPAAQPPSATAFGMFWQRLSTLEEWMPGELGPASAYTPQRISVAVVAPHDPSGLDPNRVAWPLERPFAETGEAWVMPETRCATFEGDELEALLPLLTASTQITIFVDSTDAERGLLVRPLVPGEPTPCGAAA